MRSARRSIARDRRLAATVLALAALVAAGGGALFSCVATERASGPDFTIPRDLKGAPTMRVALERGAPKATIEVRGPYEIIAAEGAGARPAFAGESLPPTEISLGGPAEPGGEGHGEGGSGTAGASRGLVVGSYLFRPGVVRVVAKRSGTLVVGGTLYRGDLVVRSLPDGSGLLVVNTVNLEEYVAGVVGSEMPLAFPDAALRAQAVVSRTYGLHAQRARAGELYDVMDDQSSQVYKGLTNETDRARQVTLDTLGVILTYRGRVFPAYFHSTCGGETIPAAWAFGEAADIPPLGGGTCGFCEDSKYYRWRCEVRRADLAARLAKEGFPVGAVAKVEVIERGPAGHVATVRVVHAGGELRIRGTKLRSLVGTSAIRSTAFDVEDAGGETIAFAGRGWGHAVGMCQIGARGMARAGHDAVAIVRRYYPAAELVRIYAAAAGPAEHAAKPGEGGCGSVAGTGAGTGTGTGTPEGSNGRP